MLLLIMIEKCPITKKKTSHHEFSKSFSQRLFLYAGVGSRPHFSGKRLARLETRANSSRVLP
jgi:hypothetical protein